MNILLWILQVLLALHTIIGALWKFSNSEQVVDSLHAIPHVVWIILGIIEVFCSLGLILAVFKKSFGRFIPVAAIIVALEMVFFIAVSIFSSEIDYSQIIYWLVVAAISSFIAYGRKVLKPIS